jgi:cytochrome b
MTAGSHVRVSHATSQEQPAPRVSADVWDVPTRLFHWLLFLAVVVSYASSEEQGWLFAVHTASGYIVALLLLFRLVWGFVGSRHSRFADFVRGPRGLAEYVKQLMHLRPPRFVGHNPLGGWMVIALMAVLGLTVLTGLLSAEEDSAARGILFPLIASYGEEGLSEIHEFLGNLVVVLAGVHVAAVFADWLLTRENLIAAMLTGRKHVDPAVAAREAPLVSGRRALIIALLVALAGVALFRATDFAGMIAGPARVEGQADEHD